MPFTHSLTDFKGLQNAGFGLPAAGGMLVAEPSENKAGMSFICCKLSSVDLFPSRIRRAEPVQSWNVIVGQGFPRYISQPAPAVLHRFRAGTIATLGEGQPGIKAGMYKKNKVVAYISASQKAQFVQRTSEPVKSSINSEGGVV